MADLLIYDAVLIAEIENGKREVSCGYECENVPCEDGRIYQRNITGNHIAVVSAGRAGSQVAIKDSSPEIDNKNKGDLPPKQGRRTKMSTKRRKHSETGIVPAIANLFQHFNRDADPEELTEVVEDLVDVITEEVKGEEAPPVKADEAPTPAPTSVAEQKAVNEPVKDDETTALLKQIAEQVAALTGEVAQLKEAKEKDTDPLQKLEDELSGNESALVKPSEEIDGEPSNVEQQDDEAEKVADEAGVIIPAEDRPKNPLNKDAALKEVQKMKPIVAAIKDPKQRAIMSDSLAKIVRMAYSLPTAQQNPGGGNNYSAILDAQKRAANAHNTGDKNVVTNQDILDLGKKIAESRNPHHMKKS